MTAYDPMAGWRHAEATSDVTLELPSGGGPMFFRAIPAGEFVMGSRGNYDDEEPRVRVRIERGFWMATFPVTQRQFGAFTRDRRIEHKNNFHGDQLPAESLTCFEALAFCRWLGRHLVNQEHFGGFEPSLPTEAEWEFACRAGTTTEFWSGDGEAALARAGWYSGNSNGRTHVVGEMGPGAANPLGLFDVHGNVLEWCLDRMDITRHRSQLDGDRDSMRASFIDDRDAAEQEQEQAARVVRGGSFVLSAGRCRSAYRIWRGPSDRFWIQGFRVCLLPGPSPQPSARPSTEAEARARGRERGGTTSGGPRPSAAAVGRATMLREASFPHRSTDDEDSKQ